MNPLDDTILASLAVERGLLKREEADECLKRITTEAAGETASPVNLATLLVSTGRLTAEHVEELSRIYESRLAESEAETIVENRRATPAPAAKPPTRRAVKTPLAKSPNPAPVSVATEGLPPEAASHAGNPDYCFKQFILTRELGRGGMGVVWQAWQCDLKRWVAIKFFESDDAEEEDRFIREAQAVSALSHPNITALYELGKHEEQYYLVMEYVDGRPIQASLGHIPQDQALKIFHTCALAVDHAHRHNIIHRDIKPHNIMLTKAGKPYLMDFGLAKRRRADSGLTTAGTILGTPAYMPPEQAEGKIQRIDRRSDVYSLAASLYSVLAGRPPFSGKQVLDTLYKVVHNEPPALRRLNARVSADVEAVVHKAMSKAPIDRYPNAREFAADLQRCINGERVQAGPPGTLRAGKRPAANRAPVLVAGAVVVAAIFGILLVKSGRGQATTPPPDPVVQKLPPTPPSPAAPARPSLAEAEREYAEAEATLSTARGKWAILAEHAERCAALADRAAATAGDFPEAYLLKGRALALKGTVSEARAAFERAADRPPVQLELALLAAGEDDAKALDHLKRYLRSEADLPDRTFALALEALLERRIPEAINGFTSVLQQRERADALLFRAAAHELAVDGKAAMDDYKAAVRLEPNRPSLLVRAADFAEQIYELRQAESWLKAALDFHPDCDSALMLLARVHVHECERTGDFTDPIDRANRAISLNPDRISHYGERAWVLERSNHPEEAIRDADKYLAVRPKDGAALITRGVAKSRLKDTAGAMADYEAALVDTDATFARLNLSYIYTQARQKDKAVRVLEEGLASNSSSILGWYHLGRALAHHGITLKALTCFDRAAKLNPNYGPALNDRFKLLLSMGEWSRAEQDAVRQRELRKDGQGEATYQSDMGEVETGRGNFARALEYFGKSIELNGADAWTFVARGNCHFRMKKWKRAADDYREALRLHPHVKSAVAKSLEFAESQLKEREE